MPAGEITVSENYRVADGENVKTVTVESFSGWPSPPGDARDIQRSHEDGKYTLRYTIQDGQSQQDTYTLSASVSQEPLATHPLFKDIEDSEWKKFKAWEKDPGDESIGGWTPDSESASASMRKYSKFRNKGIEDYLLGTVTLRVAEDNQGTPRLSNLGRIDSPSYAPSLPNSRNWLLVGIDAERTGASGRWRVTREYRASGPGGWNEELYSKT